MRVRGNAGAMKRALRAFCVCLLAAAVSLPRSADAERGREGFFLSLGVGPSLSHTRIIATHPPPSLLYFGPEPPQEGAPIPNLKERSVYSGLAVIASLKAGYTVFERLALSVELMGHRFSQDDAVVQDATVGAGVDYHLPRDFFVGGSIGLFRLHWKDVEEVSYGGGWGPNGSYQGGSFKRGLRDFPNPGLMVHARAGKEWRIANHVSLGFTLGYHFGSTETDPEPPRKKHLGIDYSLHRASTLFSVTLH